MKSFASDNYAPVLPLVMKALQNANAGHARSYGADEITERTIALFRRQFDQNADVYFVFNGTGANILSISSATHSFNSVLCADISHIYNDESSAPETFTGCRFFSLPTNENGKLEVDTIRKRLVRAGDVHYAQPAMLSITQSTEYGTLYTIDEIKNIAALCREHGIYLHMDGSRFFNAAASMACNLSEISTEAGVDILSLGGTKAGMMFGEAVIVFNADLKKHIAFKQKQVIQLASKTRYIAAQFEAMLTNDHWRSPATHANEMAILLENELKKHPGIRITKPVQANVVFAELPREWNAPLQAIYPFYIWQEATNEARLMCAWDTTPEDIMSFSRHIAGLSMAK
jgi:threonine aldolase